jgi:hypothetical protein
MTHLEEIPNELELVGIITRDGGFKRNPKTGELRPTYVIAPGLSESEAQRRLQLLSEADNLPPQ